MAYGTKYKFKFENTHGKTYEVRLMENGYSGSVTSRPLGGAPVIRMQESGAFRPTSCELTLECQVDGEFASLYTSDPNQYKIVIYDNTDIVWQGFVATELYSEPSIAPPYDVKVTATDGLGVLKEYDFVPAGVQTVREHLDSFLSMTGMNNVIYCVSSIKAHGDTVENFFDDVEISLDYHDGDSVYEALEDLLKTMRCFVTQWKGDWLIVRETDVTVNSSGRVACVCCPVSSSTPAYGTTLNYMTATVGQMGVANMWPIGFLTRTIRPAKKSVKVQAEWHLRDAAPDLDSWVGSGDASGGSGGSWYLGMIGGVGTMRGSVTIVQFNYDLKVTVKCYRDSVWQNYSGAPYVAISASFFSGGAGEKYYHPDTGWTSTSPATGEEHSVTKTKTNINPEPPQEITVTIPSPSDTNGGFVFLTVIGHLVNVVGVEAVLDRGKGFEDTIVIDNGARGAGTDISITGGRQVSGDAMNAYWADGIFFSAESHGIVYSFDDADNTDLDYLSLTALNYAKVHAAPRIETTGTIDFPSDRVYQPFVILNGGLLSLMESYDWNLKEAEINFKAVTIPTAVLSVDSETITSIPE